MYQEVSANTPTQEGAQETFATWTSAVRARSPPLFGMGRESRTQVTKTYTLTASVTPGKARPRKFEHAIRHYRNDPSRRPRSGREPPHGPVWAVMVQVEV
jgi:hypothetical protein